MGLWLEEDGIMEKIFGRAMEVNWEGMDSREMLKKLFFNSNDIDKYQK